MISKMLILSALCLLCLCVAQSAAGSSCPELPLCFCSNDKTSINCDGKRLTSVPAEMPSSVTKLYLRNNFITTVKAAEFGHLYRLEMLWLDNNKITTIEPYAFSNLSMLTTVDMRNNKIQRLDKGAFFSVIRLAKLNLANNLIENIDEETFTGSDDLNFLSLQANKLIKVPALGRLPSLKQLILVENSISELTFPTDFRQCKQLSYIALSQNSIKTLTNGSFHNLQNNSLSTLSLSVNKIARVEPGAFEPLASISSLTLGQNPLDSENLKLALEGLQGKSIVSLDISHVRLNGVLMKDTFALLTNMTIATLDMKYNTIKTLPNSAFVGLNYLQHLDISNCEIEQTQDLSFDGLNKLTILNMEKNKLTKVPQNLPSSLQYLYLDYNMITTLPNKAFVNLGLLKETRIRHNKIQRVEEDCFLSLSSLTKLSLRDNYISTLPGKMFEPLFRLVSLDLSMNNLNSIPDSSPGRFSSMSSLIYLSLTDNKCSYFPKDFFKDLRSLKYLHLERNLLGELIARNYGGAIFQGLISLQELYLMENEIHFIPDPTFQFLNSLTFLNISRNKVAGWGSDLFKSTSNLATFDASINLIATIREGNIKGLTSVQAWNLTGNPFLCNCDLRWFRDWINRTSVTLTGVGSYMCSAPPDWSGNTLFSFDKTKINCEHYTLKIIIISCAVVAAVVIILCISTYLRRWHIKLFFYKLGRRTKRRKRVALDGRGGYGAIEKEKLEFDAYISCAEEDKEWVRRYLLPGIDKGKLDDNHEFGGQYALYFEDRDAVPGEPLVGNIFENMKISRKVLVILSRNYLTDRMHIFEVDLAIEQMYERTIDEIIVIHIDQGLPRQKIPRFLAKTMRRHHMIEWSSDENAQELFTRTLADRLAVNANAADKDAE